MQYPDISKSFYNTDAEHALIGAFLVDNRALKLVPELSVEHFTEPATKAAIQAIQRLVARQEKVDLVTVSDELTKMGQDEHLTTIIDYAQRSVSSGMAGQYAKIVRGLATRRRFRDALQESLDAINDPETGTDDEISRVRQKLRDMVTVKYGSVEMAEMLLRTYEHLSRVNEGAIKPIRTGMSTLDNLTGGFFPGEFTVVGARPGGGKSAFALNVGLSAAKSGKRVHVVSIEMSEQQYGQRTFSREARINGMKLRTGDIDDAAWSALAEIMALDSGLPMSFNFEDNTLEDIVLDAQRRYDDGKLDMLIIDYLQLMRTRQKFESERIRVGFISHELKRLSKDLNIPVIALAQLRRAESGRNYVPRMSELKESGDLEQDADGIILMHRAEKADDYGVLKDDREIFDELTRDGRKYILFNVDKQRQGETGVFATIFNAPFMEYLMIDRGR